MSLLMLMFGWLDGLLEDDGTDGRAEIDPDG